MAYIDGFVLAVPDENKQKFIDHADKAGSVFIDMGATRLFECWGDDVPDGKVTDFKGAVQAADGESVVFSWIEWPDKATRDAGMARLMAPDFKDERMDPTSNPMPFDGKRMIMGGFESLLDEGSGGTGAYADGFVIPVPDGNRQAYRDMAAKAWPLFKEYGALRLVEAWADDVPDGKQTDFRRSVKAEEGEQVVFSFIEWPDKSTRDAGQKRMMEQDFDGEMPFDGKRMIWGGFTPVVAIGG